MHASSLKINCVLIHNYLSRTKNLFYHEHAQAMEHVAQRCRRVSIFGESQNTIEQCSEQPALAGCFEQEAGLDISSCPLHPQLFYGDSSKETTEI